MIPALLIRTSRTPNSVRVVSIRRSTAFSEATSVSTKRTLSAPARSRTASCPASPSQSAITTRYPEARKACAVPLPIPRAPPVITANVLTN
jgi:hypothetical protein